MTPNEMNALLSVAQRVVWYKPAAEAMAHEPHFVAHVLCHGSLADIQEARAVIGDTRIARALDVAPSGVFTPRQWKYWNRFYGKTPVPPAPARRLSS